MKQFYKAANIVLVTTTDGVEHVYHFTEGLIGHGGKKPGVDALEGLREGTMIAIHRTTNEPEASVVEIDLVGDEGWTITEGAVIDIEIGESRRSRSNTSTRRLRRSRSPLGPFPRTTPGSNGSIAP